MKRRQFIKQAGALSLGAALFSQISCSTGKKNPNILVVSGWQDVNIGDIAHTPGLLHVLESAFPEATIVLWKRSRSEKVENLLRKNFPKINLVFGNVDKDFNVIDDEGALQAMDQADIFIHGSGPSVVAASHLQAWAKITTKPFGTYGVTIENISDQLAALLKKASFIFTRETTSIEKLKQAGITGPHIMFAPDATFDLDMKDDDTALRFMKDNGLEEGKFLCVIPRLRKTPYWEFTERPFTKEHIEKFTALNNKWKEDDHAKAREAIVTWVKTTGNKVVLCPEMVYEMGLYDELLYNPLPDDVKPYVVKHDYWMPDEAMSLYARMHTLISFECHSPIMAIRCGRPAFYLRHPQDTIKGQMYYDLGLSDWVFEIEQSTGKQISDRLTGIINDYDGARKKAADALLRVSDYYAKANALIGKLIK